MSLSNKRLCNGLRLSAVSLTLALAGCSGNPPAYEPAGSESTSPSREPVQQSAPAPYKPTLVRVDEGVPLAEGHPNEYVVQVGDTLWDIAAKFLKDPWYWPEIWYINPDIVNPHLIYPGDVLALVMIDGQQRITNVRASTYRMSPEARVTPLTEAIDSIPYEDVAAFLSSGVILEKGQADRLPYLVDTRGDHLIASAGNEVYVRGVGDELSGKRYQVVKIGDPATVALTSSSQEAKQGDRLLPESVDIPLNFYPSAPSANIDGRIISVVGGVTQIGQYMVVVMNRGTNNGLEVGDVLTVWQSGDVVKDRVEGGKVKLPDEEAGTVMVFKVFDRISYGLVMEATQAIHIHDAVRNPT